ncbi:MAG TPA: DUF4236 domain-containing protein [Verrucomicrobiae bacterium]|jgi:hypothetical protein
MGWRFRKAFGRGPFRFSLTKKGIGGSWGIPGLRFGISPSGQRYFSTGIPGTGLYYIRYFPNQIQPPQTPSPSPGQPIFPKNNQFSNQVPHVQQPSVSQPTIHQPTIPKPPANQPTISSQPVNNQIPWWKQKDL